MARLPVLYLLPDTSYLREVGLEDPDFQKLLRHCRNGTIKIVVPHIVWEERRTQLIERSLKSLRQARAAIDVLKAPWLQGLISEGLVPSTLTFVSDAEVHARSVAVLSQFADAHKIEIVPLGADHASRAWKRYFESDLPFTPERPRLEQRKHIPDAWILEAAIDLKKVHGALSALCGDDGLTTSLQSAGVTGIVSGEFGFAEAYERKKTEVTSWLDDHDDAVRQFARYYVGMLDEMIASERRRATEEIALRKQKYGE